MARRIVIRISKDGITMDFNGFVGRTCFKEAEKIYELLRSGGANVTIKGIKEKPELYVSETTSTKVRTYET